MTAALFLACPDPKLIQFNSPCFPFEISPPFPDIKRGHLNCQDVKNRTIAYPNFSRSQFVPPATCENVYP